jgi:hypothetical protein
MIATWFFVSTHCIILTFFRNLDHTRILTGRISCMYGFLLALGLGRPESNLERINMGVSKRFTDRYQDQSDHSFQNADNLF